MANNLRNLAIVLAVALAVFALAKPLCLRYMSEGDFVRRRNVWCVLTAAGFLSPNFWIFVLLAVPILVWSGSKETNPAAFFLLVMHVVPPFGVHIPTVLVNQLFELNLYRILAIVVLFPAAVRLIGTRPKGDAAATVAMDRLLLGYCGLGLLLVMPYESFTNTMRRTFLLCIDVLLLYYVVSRTCTSRRAIVEAMASFVLACAIAAPLALLENLSTSQLYSRIGEKWGLGYLNWATIMRGDSLRAPVSAGHALALGYLLAMAFGLWLHLRTDLKSRSLALIGSIWIWVGLAATLSRGPWLTAILAYFAYMAAGRHGSARLVKGMFTAILVGGLIFASPLGDTLLDLLPFVGSVDSENVVYRQRLAEVSWQLILEHPLFGDPFFLANMEEMRQGQGIIDLVNVYAAVALQSGLIGLSLFVGFFLMGIWKIFQCSRRVVAEDPGLADIGASLLACMLGTLLMMVTGSFGTALAIMFFALAGLAAGYATMVARRESPAVATRAALPNLGKGGVGTVPSFPPRLARPAEKGLGQGATGPRTPRGAMPAVRRGDTSRDAP